MKETKAKVKKLKWGVETWKQQIVPLLMIYSSMQETRETYNTTWKYGRVLYNCGR